MANGYRSPDFGALEQRVYNLEQGISNLTTQIGGLSTKIDERSRTSWPTLAAFGGLLVLVMGGLGTLAYWPIEKALTRIETNMPSYIGRREFDYVIKQAERDLLRIEKQVQDNLEAIVPRGEHQEKWRGYDQAIANIQRQIDEQRQAFGSTYSLRDAFADVQRKVHELEKELRPRRD